MPLILLTQIAASSSLHRRRSAPPTFLKSKNGKRLSDSRHLKRAYTLFEMLAVMAIIALLSVGAVESVSGIMGAGNISQASSDISGVIEQGRAYAMANNTYVYIGFDEVSNAQDGTTQQAGVGRVVISVVATTNGLAATSSPITSITPITKLRIIRNLHLGNLAAVTSGNMARTASPVSLYDDSTGTPATAGAFTFTWPINSATPQYTFNTVLQIDPQGEVSFVQSATSAAQYLVPSIEIGLQETFGTTIPPTGTGQHNYAAVQVEGITGNVQIYRP